MHEVDLSGQMDHGVFNQAGLAGDRREGLVSDRNLGVGRPNGVSSDCATVSYRFF
jgi:hypothetical protein